jgi:hypothetical protein
MPDIRVQDEQGTIHVFPDGSTPEMIAKAMGVKPPAAPATMGPDTRGGLQRLNDWWMRRPAYEGTLGSPGRSPREKAKDISKGIAVGSLPLLGGALAAAPLATTLGLAGGTGGGVVGGYLGRKAGELVDAPELGEDIGGLAGNLAGAGTGLALKTKIPGLFPSAKGAGAALSEVKSVAGNVPIKMGKAGDTALELYTQSQRGGTLPKAVRDLVNRVTKPESKPITYAEAKDFQSNISRLSVAERMRLTPNVQRLVGQLAADLKTSLKDAADTVGKGEQFSQAMKEYHQAMQIRGMTDAAKAGAWKWALRGAGAYGIYKLLGIREPTH